MYVLGHVNLMLNLEVRKSTEKKALLKSHIPQITHLTRVYPHSSFLKLRKNEKVTSARKREKN
jgi:hypothetical protein